MSLHPIPTWNIKFPEIKIISKDYHHEPGDWTTYYKVKLDWSPVDEFCLSRNCSFPLDVLEQLCKSGGFEYDVDMAKTFLQSHLDLDNLFYPRQYQSYFNQTFVVPKVYLDKMNRYRQISETEIHDLNTLGQLEHSDTLSKISGDKSPNILKNCVDMFFWLLTRHEFKTLDGVKIKELIRTLYLYRFWKWQTPLYSPNVYDMVDAEVFNLVFFKSNFENPESRELVLDKLSKTLQQNLSQKSHLTLYEMIDSEVLFSHYKSFIRNNTISKILH